MQFSRKDQRAIMGAGINAGLPPDIPIAIVYNAPSLDPVDLEAACELMGYEPAAPTFIAGLIDAGVLFDLEDVPPADEDEGAGVTSTDTLVPEAVAEREQGIEGLE